MKKPIIGITMGDAAGIGPELIVKLFATTELHDLARMIVIGDADVMDAACSAMNADTKINVIDDVRSAKFEQGTMDLIDLDNLGREHFASGRVDKTIGQAAVAYTIKAAELAMKGEIDAIASAPLNKEAMHLAGFDYAGQTELLADITKTEKYAMVLYFGPIKMFYVTNHVSLSDALKSINKDAILAKIKFIHETLSELGESNTSIAVAALNPHAGENGKMGHEEIDEISPAIMEARNDGINAIGPVPADVLFVKAKEGIYGAVLVMYHDQGNIAAKLLNFGSGVTVVSGLPFIRTSVAHGTAYDIAGKGIASPNTLIEAIKLAVTLANNK